MKLDALLEALQEAFPFKELNPRPVPVGETFITLPPDCLHRAVRLSPGRMWATRSCCSTISGITRG